MKVALCFLACAVLMHKICIGSDTGEELDHNTDKLRILLEKINARFNSRQVPAIGFTVCYSRSESTALSASDRIVFDRTITNVGDAYNAEDGKFTAPYRGLYVFHLSVMTPPKKHQYVSIVKDGDEVAFDLADARGNSAYETGSFQWVVDLEKGSQIWIKAWRAGYIHGFCHSKFSGHLVSLM